MLEQIEHDGSGLEDAEVPVLERRDAPVRVDLQEPVFLLGVRADVDCDGLVRDAELLEDDGGFEAVGRAEGVVG